MTLRHLGEGLALFDVQLYPGEIPRSAPFGYGLYLLNVKLLHAVDGLFSS
jgi:hypothetical protein